MIRLWHAGVLSQRPAWQRSSPWHGSSSPQEVPSGSTRQVGEQQSPAVWLPSSHSSPGSSLPSPHVAGTVVLVVAATVVVGAALVDVVVLVTTAVDVVLEVVVLVVV